MEGQTEWFCWSLARAFGFRTGSSSLPPLLEDISQGFIPIQSLSPPGMMVPLPWAFPVETQPQRPEETEPGEGRIHLSRIHPLPPANPVGMTRTCAHPGSDPTRDRGAERADWSWGAANTARNCYNGIVIMESLPWNHCHGIIAMESLPGNHCQGIIPE